MSGWNLFYKFVIPTCSIEICDYPAESDVVKDVEYANKTMKGIFDEGLPWTGQITEYRTGDDGDLQKGHTTDRPIVKGVGSHRFIDNGDGTITDKATGLMWAKDGNGVGCYNGQQRNWEQAIDWAINLVFAGHEDWRLPNIKELMSIVDYDRINPAIDPIFFPNTKSSYYWSSTTLADLVNVRWRVWFHYATVSNTSGSSAHYVRAVRGSA